MEFDPTKHIPIADHVNALKAQQAEFDKAVVGLSKDRDDAVKVAQAAEERITTDVAAAARAAMESHADDIARLQKTHGDLMQEVGEKALKEIELRNARILELEAEITRLTSPPPINEKLSELNAVFKEAVPKELWGAFTIVFATVRVLLQAGELELARATIEATPVPEDLKDAKALILSKMP